MAWAEDAALLKDAGFGDDEIAAEGQAQREQLAEAGFKPEQIDEHFGIKEPDMTPIKNMLTANLNMRADEYKALAAEGKQVPEVADTFLEALDAGFQNSSGDMMVKALQGKRVTPDMLLPEDADTFFRIASQVGTLAGDLPAMIAGTVIGGGAGAAAGTAIAGPGPGTAIGAIAGAGGGGMGLPTAIRQSLMEYYEKGEINNFQDFWERTSAVLLNTAKDTAIGTVSAGVGGKVLGASAKVLAPSTSKFAGVSSEIATMVALGRGFEGEAPKLSDFTDAALLVGGLKIAGSTAGKLRKIYAETGKHPAMVVQEAMVDPVLKTDLLTKGDEIPDAYRGDAQGMKIEGMLPEQPDVTAQPKPKVEGVEPTAQDKILSKISSPEKAEKPSYTANDFYKDAVDKLDPINRATKELAGSNPDTINNPYELARMSSDAPAKALHFLGSPTNPKGGGVLDYQTLKKTGPSLQEILTPHAKDIKSVEAYIVSKRALELEARGIKSGFDLNDIKQVVKEGAAKYEKTATQITEFQNGALKYLKDSGFMSETSFNKLVESGKSYVSFKRISDEGTVSGGTKGAPIKKIVGSDLNIQDPLISIAENTEFYLTLAERNRAKRSLVELAEQTEGQAVLEKQKIPQRPITVSGEEISKALEKQGIEIDAEAITVFRKGDRPLAKDEFEIFRDGKREVYKTADPSLAEAINTLDGNAPAQNIAFRLMRGITTVKRLGISLAPDFIARNFTRDQITAGVFSKSGSVNPFKNVVDVVSAMGDIISKNDNYFNWLKAGGANGAFVKLDDLLFKDNVIKLHEETGFMDKAWNVVKSPKQTIEMVATLAEQSTRLSEAKRVMKGSTEGPEVFRAGMASREITVDFMRVGAKISSMNAITAFMNAGIQGLDRTARAVKQDPIGTTGKAAALITTPSVLLWWANKDDERVKEIPQWQKDAFWIIPTDSWEKAQPGEASSLPAHLVREGSNGTEVNKGTIYRIPKPLELGMIFGTLPERALDAFFTDNPESFKGFGETIMGLITPTFIPDAVTPILEQATNKSFFTGNKIVPGHVEDVLPAYQYTDYTTETAKALGKLIAPVPFIGDGGIFAGPKGSQLASPMVLENYVRSWSGSMGMYALQLADKGLQMAGVTDVAEKPAWSVAEIPFVKAFTVKYPSAQAESIRSFYDAADDNQRVINTVKSLTKRGELDEAQKVMFDEENAEKMQNLSGIQKALRNQSVIIQQVYRNPDMKADEKRQLIDGIYYGMIQTAKMGNEMNKEVKSLIKEQNKAAGE